MPHSPARRLALGRWLGWTSVGLLTIYLLVTGGAWWFVKYHRNVSRITYGDIALPSNWDRYQIKRGNHLIAQARQFLESGQSSRGFHLLRMGLARAPANRDGRILLSQLFERINRDDLAKETLQTGLKYHRNDHAYLATILRFLIEQHDDASALALSTELLSDASTPDQTIKLAALSAATVHYHRGDFDLAESQLKAHYIGKTREGRLLQAQLEWDRGYRELAIILLRELQHDFPSSEEIYTRLHTYLRSENLNGESRRLAILHQIKHPDRAGSHLDRIRSLEADGDEDGATQASRNMINTFAKSPSALLALGDFAATKGNVAIAQSLQAHFQKNSLPDSNVIQLLLIEALLNAEQYQEAIQEAAKLSQGRDTGTIDQTGITAKGLSAIAHYGLKDPGSGSAQLSAFMAQPQLRPASLVAIADRLATMGYRDTAEEILTQALKLAPQSQPILTRLVEYSLEERDAIPLTHHLRVLLTVNRPSPTILAGALNLLSSDRFLFLANRDALISELEARLNKR